jgi:hypothetical protein
MKQSVQILLSSLAALATVVGVALSVKREVAPPQPEPTPAPNVQPVKPAPVPKTKMLLFTQDGCAPCRTLKALLTDPQLAGWMRYYDVEEVHRPDKRFRQYAIKSVPELVALSTQGPRIFSRKLTIEDLQAWLSTVPINLEQVIEQIQEGGPVGPGGVEVTTDLPVELRHKNIAGTDGAGCCPFASVQHSARWQNEKKLWNFLEDVGRHNKGGGWPEKMTAMIKKYGSGAQFVQYEGRDPSILSLALKTGRMPAITYCGRDCHYSGNIAHMVSLIYLSKEKNLACILDNNYIQACQLVWMSYDELISRWLGNGGGWAVILLNPRPPLPPRNGG